jgi:DNA-binding GntR family transcriptional regulator
VERTRGRGTFVSAGAAQVADRTRLTLDEMIASAVDARTLLRTGSAVPPAVVATALGLGPAEETPFFIRLSGSAETSRIGVKRYLSPALADRLDELAQADDFDALLAASDRRAWVEAILAEPRFAMQLKVPLGSPLLSLWWTDLLDGRPAACTQMLRPGAAATLELGSWKEHP